MKAMTKQQLAQCAGVTVRMQMNWCRQGKEIVVFGAGCLIIHHQLSAVAVKLFVNFFPKKNLFVTFLNANFAKTIIKSTTI